MGIKFFEVNIFVNKYDMYVLIYCLAWRKKKIVIVIKYLRKLSKIIVIELIFSNIFQMHFK